jgi:drug/metabolite transporter (DMT)-like permease
MNALFAATFPLGKFALQYTGPVFLTAIRMLMAGLILLIYSFYNENKTLKIPLRDYLLFAKTSLFYVVLAFVPEFWALKYLSSIKTNLLWSVQPLLAALLGFILFSEKLSYKKIIALAIGFAGMLPIIFTCDIGAIGFSDICTVSYPEISLFIAVFSTIYGWFLIKELLAKHYSLSLINGITMTFGGFICLLLSFAEHFLYQQELYSNFGAVVGYSLLLVLASNIVGYGLYGYFLSHYSITFLSFSGFTCPLFGFLFSYMLDEPIYNSYIFGCALIMLGLVIFYLEE